MLNGLVDTLKGWKKYDRDLEESIHIYYKSRTNKFNKFIQLLNNVLIFGKDYTFDTDKYLPRDWKVCVFSGQRQNGQADFTHNTVWTKPLTSMEGVSTLLHEIGHLKDYFQNSKLIYRDDDINHKNIWLQSNKELILKGAKAHLEREYVAWDFAFDIINKLGVSPKLNNALLKHSEKCLLAYIDSLDYKSLFYSSKFDFRDEMIQDLAKWKGQYRILE